MATRHPFRPHYELFQNRISHEIRIEEFPDDDVFYTGDRAAIENHYLALERKHAQADEWMIRFSVDEVLGDCATKAVCPICQSQLWWKSTGIE
jgi:hypothetical protein